MKYLLDTTTLSDLMRDHPQTEARVAGLPAGDRAVTCPVVRGEVLYGIERMAEGKRRTELAAKAQRTFGRVPCVPTPCAAGDRYARIKRAQEREGLPLDENDLWIAATAIALGAILVTRDSDFGYVAGLRTENWRQ